jgi:hypothetical protein
MFDDIKDAFAKLSIARLQKRIDVLKAHQEMLDKFTLQRTLSELEHYRLQLWLAASNSHRGKHSRCRVSGAKKRLLCP